MVYLWLCCEGWQRFGPFQHLNISASVISDESEEVVAVRTAEGGWHTPGVYCCYSWRANAVVTSTADHPYPMRGQA